MSQFFIKDCDEQGYPKLINCACGQIFTEQGMANHRRGCKQARIRKLSNRLYYINNKDEINKNRKKYKRQAWQERADNPANKRGKMLDD